MYVSKVENATELCYQRFIQDSLAGCRKACRGEVIQLSLANKVTRGQRGKKRKLY